jgi:excisionase family DNA binding protein
VSLEETIQEAVRAAVRAETADLSAQLSKLAGELQRSLRAGTTQVLTVNEFATELKVAPATVHEWIRRGHVAAALLPGGREYRIRRTELERLVSDAPAKAGATAPATEAARILSLPRRRMNNGGT